MKRAVLSVVIAALCAGCNITDPEEPSFAFSISRRETIDFSNPKLVVTGRDGGITIEGETWTACANGTLAGVLERPSETGLALIITDVQETDTCLGAVAPYHYDAIVGQLEPGRYHLQILLRHSRGATPPRTIFHDFVQVR